MYDIAVIGAGVVGSLIARELTKYAYSVCVLEANTDVSMGASSANSGIVHAGHDALPGTLKAKFNALGSCMMADTASQLGVGYKNNGTLVLAYGESDERTLAELLERGKINGIGELSIISGDEVRKIEPNVSKNVTSALSAGTGGIVSPYGLAIAAMGNAMDNGADLRLRFRVADIKKEKDGYTVFSEKGDSVRTRLIINCAGIYSDIIAGMLGDKSFKVAARKGEYILIDHEAAGFVKNTLFTCPNEKGKGVLVTPTVHGPIILGPTSIEGDDREDNSVSAESFKYIIEHARNMCDNLPLGQTITSFCGIRAFSDRHDFVIEQSSADRGLINVAGIESPGLTAAPAIAEYVAGLVGNALGERKENPKFSGIRVPDTFFKELSLEEKNALIKKDPTFGRIICRCEGITLGEILFTVRRNPSCETVDGVKRRVRPGMGRCQGGFCQPYIAELLATELGIKYDDILKSGEGSNIFFAATK